MTRKTVLKGRSIKKVENLWAHFRVLWFFQFLQLAADLKWGKCSVYLCMEWGPSVSFWLVWGHVLGIASKGPGVRYQVLNDGMPRPSMQGVFAVVCVANGGMTLFLKNKDILPTSKQYKLRCHPKAGAPSMDSKCLPLLCCPPLELWSCPLTWRSFKSSSS